MSIPYSCVGEMVPGWCCEARATQESVASSERSHSRSRIRGSRVKSQLTDLQLISPKDCDTNTHTNIASHVFQYVCKHLGRQSPKNMSSFSWFILNNSFFFHMGLIVSEPARFRSSRAHKNDTPDPGVHQRTRMASCHCSIDRGCWAMAS